MNLKDALLCIDCDEIFTAERASSNLHCPNCGSSVFAYLSTWVQSWAVFDRVQARTDDITPLSIPKKRRIGIVHTTHRAA